MTRCTLDWSGLSAKKFVDKFIGLIYISDMQREKIYAIRNEIHGAERLIPKSDRSPEAERARDLIAVACVALWEDDSPRRALRALRRLAGVGSSHQRFWGMLYTMACMQFMPSMMPVVPA